MNEEREIIRKGGEGGGGAQRHVASRGVLFTQCKEHTSHMTLADEQPYRY